MRARLVADYGKNPDWLRMYREARHYADYWQRHGENARAPSWYYPA